MFYLLLDVGVSVGKGIGGWVVSESGGWVDG